MSSAMCFKPHKSAIRKGERKENLYTYGQYHVPGTQRIFRTFDGELLASYNSNITNPRVTVVPENYVLNTLEGQRKFPEVFKINYGDDEGEDSNREYLIDE